MREFETASRPVSSIPLVDIDRAGLNGQLSNALRKLEADEKKAAANTGPDALLDYGGCACGDNQPAAAPNPAGPATPNTGPVVQKGATGPRVEALQFLLNQSGAGIQVDGDFGDQTEDAVKDFQKNRDFEVRDGKVDAKTWAALWVTLVHHAPQQDAVKALQTLLAFNGIGVEVDGDFGDQTLSAVRGFQTLKAIPEGVVVGPLTWAALVRR
jgi:peptidoglycan hydrolase-like protein with peptidoglycan-binding domain